MVFDPTSSEEFTPTSLCNTFDGTDQVSSDLHKSIVSAPLQKSVAYENPYTLQIIGEEPFLS
jgi:hypothetical protein